MNDSPVENIVVVSIDSLRWDYIFDGSMDTPALNELRQTGVFFDTVITPAPFTIPSHASMFSGLLPYNHGIRDQRGTFAELRTNHSLFRILSDKGYEVASLDSSPILDNRGFGWNHLASANEENIPRALSRIESPFLVFIHFWEAHTPYFAKLPSDRIRDILANHLRRMDPDAERNRLQESLYNRLRRYRIDRIRDLIEEGNGRIIEELKRGYTEGIERIDEKISHIIEVLDSENVLEETLVVITSDHGESFNEYNEINRQADRRYEHGHFLYDTLIRIPAVFAHPQFDQTKVSSQVSTTDYVPTILDLLDVATKLDFDGASLVPFLFDEGEYDRRLAYSEVERDDGTAPQRVRSIRSNDYKLIVDKGRNERHLFNVDADPYEKTNLYEEKSEIRDELRSVLNEHMDRDQSKRNAETLSSEERKEMHRHLSSLGYT